MSFTLAKSIETAGLYDILGIKSDSTLLEIRRAYKLRALQVHPDKNITDPNSAIRFHQLQKAYDILSNVESRKLYDSTGVVESDIFGDAESYFKHRFGSISQQDIVDFEKRYRDSTEEVDDVCSYYVSHNGDLSNILSWLPLSRLEDIDRLLAVVRKCIVSGRLNALPKFEKSIPSLRKNGIKLSRIEKREASTLSTTDLVSAIMSRGSKRKSFLDDLEAKYTSQVKRK